VLFRGKQPETTVWRRFRSRAELFAFRREGDVYVAQVRASGERSVELFHALIEQMPPVTDFALECVRSDRTYTGKGLQLAEVKEAVARLKVPLVASAGVEISVMSESDQLALSANLDFWIYARSDRWLYLLLGRGLEERAELPPRGWTVARKDFTGAPELVDAVTSAAERLTLTLG
jgi:hypothetical protein